MLNQFLQAICLGVLALLLTTGVAWSSPLSNSVLIAAHTPDHDPTLPVETTPPKAVAAPSVQPSPPADTSNSVPADRKARSQAAQSMQADPSAPYDPYDYESMRQTNREIYGEKKAE